MKTHVERWEDHYQYIDHFMDEQNRRPSKHHPEERDMHNWLKYNKRRMVQGKLDERHAALLKALLDKAAGLRRVNQYL